ncbi:hypothetical protein [Salinibacterium sp. ZJ450]|uniref:hypothetical protein n=1 Tax=Salinibacterium sp. ZJ450 TaxID=2708338 RepID=UPI001421FDC4|nr:hypothetical protein [Salinibacterium sp. ZJ450]
MNLRWTDDRLAEGLTSLDPAHTAPDSATTSTDWAQLRTMMATDRRRARPPLRLRLRALWAVPIAAALVTVAVVTGSITNPPAYAQTPPPLAPTSVAEPLDEVVDESVQVLLAAPQQPARREGQLVRWRHSQDAEGEPVFIPQRYAWERDENGVASVLVTAEQPYSVLADGQITEPAGPAPTAGTRVSTAAEDEYFGGFPAAPPADTAGLVAALREKIPLRDDADGMEYWGAFRMLLSEWTLTPAHHAAMLQILEQSGGLELLGTVTDRLGRDGIALRLTSSTRTAFEVTVIIDAATRQIIASDVIYAGGLNVLDEPAGSVVEYSAWPDLRN